MARRRMFAVTIVDSDKFLDMPLTAQALYFHLSMRADDDGFINNSRRIQRLIGADEKDLNLLVDSGFILSFDSGIMLIRHWRIHNSIQKDRYKETIYQDEKSRLSIEQNGTYRLLDTNCIQTVSKMDTQVSIGKDSLDKDREEKFSEEESSEEKERIGVRGKGNNFLPRNCEFSFDTLAQNLKK